MKKGDKVAIVACSNGLAQSQRVKIEELCQTLMGIGLIPILSEQIFATEGPFNGSGRERAECLMQFYKMEEVKAIFDISGGDLSNEILSYLDYDIIAESDKCFWGYSDLTVLLNAIYARTGRQGVLYQVRNLVRDESGVQKTEFLKTLQKREGLFDIPYHFIQGNRIQGVVVGGNIRCLLKLAGTPYWPDMKGKILLLEAFSGDVAKIVTYLNQLQQMNVFNEISGILLGTFTELDKDAKFFTIESLIKKYAGENLPVARTEKIGHGADSKAIFIGKEMTLTRDLD